MWKRQRILKEEIEIVWTNSDNSMDNCDNLFN